MSKRTDPLPTKEKVSFDGTAVWRYSSSPDPERCICCPGAHRCGYGIELDNPEQYPSWRNTAVDQFWDAVSYMPDGARVRVTVEVIKE